MPWKIEGQYMETCNCSFLCPCITTNLSGTPTEGDCKAAIAMAIDEGEHEGTRLDGVNFIVVLRSPGAMDQGNIKAGLIVDEAADEAQTDAITKIATGQSGGPMAALAPLIGEFAGVERRPVRFDSDGLTRRASAGELVDQSLTGVPSAVQEGAAVVIDNTAHPVTPRLALAHADESRFHAFGIDWEDATGTRNGHFAPFSWQG